MIEEQGLRSWGESLVYFAPEAVLIYHVEKNKYVEVNPKAIELFGYNRNEFLSTVTPLEISSELQGNGIASSEQLVLTTSTTVQNQIVQSNWIARKKNGEEFPAELRLVQLPHQSETFIRVSVLDISDRVLLESELQTFKTKFQTKLVERTKALEESNKELEKFAYLVAHDLKEPMRMISAYVDILDKRLSGKLEEDELELFQFIKNGATRLKILLEGTLAYARFGTKKIQVENVPLDMIMTIAVNNLRESINETDAEIIKDESFPRVFGSSQMLVQLFQNLIANAIKFSVPNPKIEIRSKVEGNTVRISIEDNGIGINPKYTDQVFTLFQRLNKRGGKYKGEGIGLSHCKRIVELHKGKIWFVSPVKNEGTTFFVELPLAS